MQEFMVGLVSVLLIVIAGGTVVFMFMYVLREKHEHAEHFIPEASSAGAEAAAHDEQA
jgi:hypothetical protein